jgi:copper(I)-binding protein
MIGNFSKALWLAVVLPAALAGGLAWAQHAQQAAPANTATVPADPCGIKIEAPWVRATVPGQSGTGAFMRLTAGRACQLVAVQSPIAGVAQIHRMTMEGGVMRMRAVAGGLPLPAGQTVMLTPDGLLHLMLMDLKQPVAAGTSVPLAFTVQDSQTGTRARINIDAPARALDADAKDAPHSHVSH